MNDSRTARLAVLIDADNASARIADGLFEEIAKIGEASVRRIYGDFSTQRMKGWTDILARHAIIPHQQFAYTTGKNASDITLVIDAMDLLHSGRFDGFCLVSSDSDFTRLASRIREQGVAVYGFGEQKTPESFRQACRRFIYTENLLPQRGAPNRDSVEPETEIAVPLRQKADALPMLTRVIDQMESEDGWVNLGTFGKQLQALYTDFDPRTYGERKLSDLVRKTNAFEVRHPEGGSLLIRIKPGTKSAAPAALASATAPTAPARAPAAGLAPSPVAAPMPTAAELAEAAPPAKRARASGRSSTPKAAGTAAAPSSRRAASPRAAAAPKPTAAKPEPVKTETVVAPSSPVAPPAPPKLQQVVSQPAPVVTPAPVPVAAPAPAAEVAAKPAARRIHRPLGTPRS
jgi:uncharacterized LabA/DUF88 family protein